MRAIDRLVPVLAVVTLVAASCTNKKKDEEVTPRPSDEPRVEQVAEFQLVGTIRSAFVGDETPFDVEAERRTGSGPTSEPDDTQVDDPADLPGVLRIEVEDVSQELGDQCSVADGQDVRVYWIEGTRIGSSDDGVAAAEIEGSEAEFEDFLEDSVAGISGRIFREDGAADRTDEQEIGPTEEPDATDASPLADRSPGAGYSEYLSDCVLVADEIGFEADAPSPTQAPSVRRTSAPTDEPDETDEPTADPDETKKPKKTPLDTATPTAEQD